MSVQAEIMRVALDKYLGSEDQWCMGAQARDSRHNILANPTDSRARSHCAEGAITAATYEVVANYPELVRPGTRAVNTAVRKGVEHVLVEQHPDFVKAVTDANKSPSFADWTSGCSIPFFNDGLKTHTVSVDDGVITREDSDWLPSVGYQGIRAAFEKYLAECEERGL